MNCPLGAIVSNRHSFIPINILLIICAYDRLTLQEFERFMKPTNSKERELSYRVVARPKSSYSNLVADGTSTLMLAAGAALILPAVGLLVLGVAAMIVPTAATIMLSIGFSTVLAIEAALVVGSCLVSFGSWISANFGTPDFEDVPAVEQEAEVDIVTSNVPLPELKKDTHRQDAQEQKASGAVATSENSLSGLLKLGQFSHGNTAHTLQNTPAPTVGTGQKVST